MADSADLLLRQKVDAIIAEFVADSDCFIRSRRMGGPVHEAIASAFSSDYRDEVADEIAFNMLDWGDDAAFLFALYIRPDAFTPEERSLDFCCRPALPVECRLRAF